MEMIKLRTGYEAVKPVVVTTKIAVDGLMEKGIAGFTAIYDLHQMCLDKDYTEKVFPSNMELLQSTGLVDINKQIHGEITQVVLAMIEGEGPDIRIVSPVA